MVVSNVREDRVTGILSAVVAPRNDTNIIRRGDIAYACKSVDDFKNACCFLAGREAICEALATAWRALGGGERNPAGRLVVLEIEAAYSQATGNRLGVPAPRDSEPMDDIRRGLGLAPKFGHLSEIEVKLLCRQMDEAAGRMYHEAESIKSQMARVAEKIRRDTETMAMGCGPREALLALVKQLEVGYCVDTQMGNLGQVDRVVGNIPPGSAAGRFTLPEEKK